MPVGDAMTVRVVSVSPEATVQEAITRMLEEGIGAVAARIVERVTTGVMPKR